MQIESLIRSLEYELSLPVDARETGATDVSLQAVMDLLERTQRSQASGSMDIATHLLNMVAHQVTDSWSFGSALSLKILSLVPAHE